jgi:hypothetical protein
MLYFSGKKGIIHSHRDLNSVSSCTDKTNLLGPMPSRLRSPAPRVYTRAVASSDGGKHFIWLFNLNDINKYHFTQLIFSTSNPLQVSVSLCVVDNSSKILLKDLIDRRNSAEFSPITNSVFSCKHFPELETSGTQFAGVDPFLLVLVCRYEWQFIHKDQLLNLVARISCSICTLRVGSSMPSKGSISSLPVSICWKKYWRRKKISFPDSPTGTR